MPPCQPTRTTLCPGLCDSSRNRSCSPTAESPQSCGTSKPTEGSTEGFANTAQLLRHHWHIPTNGQSWKQGGGVTIISSVPLHTVHRRAGQEGAENTDGSQQLVSTECDNRNRPVLMAAITELPSTNGAPRELLHAREHKEPAILQPT